MKAKPTKIMDEMALNRVLGSDTPSPFVNIERDGVPALGVSFDSINIKLTEPATTTAEFVWQGKALFVITLPFVLKDVGDILHLRGFEGVMEVQSE